MELNEMRYHKQVDLDLKLNIEDEEIRLMPLWHWMATYRLRDRHQRISRLIQGWRVKQRNHRDTQQLAAVAASESSCREPMGG